MYVCINILDIPLCCFSQQRFSLRWAWRLFHIFVSAVIIYISCRHAIAIECEGIQGRYNVYLSIYLFVKYRDLLINVNYSSSRHVMVMRFIFNPPCESNVISCLCSNKRQFYDLTTTNSVILLDLHIGQHINHLILTIYPLFTDWSPPWRRRRSSTCQIRCPAPIHQPKHRMSPL